MFELRLTSVLRSSVVVPPPAARNLFGAAAPPRGVATPSHELSHACDVTPDEARLL